MPFEEKMTWVSAVVTAVIPTAYFVSILGQLSDTSASEVAYQVPMLIAIAAAVVLTVVGAILSAIGTAVAAEITGSGSVADIDRKDERDVSIGRRGEVVGFYVSSAGIFGALVLTMLEYDYFWIANAIYLSFAVGTLVSSAVKLVAYRRGF